MCLVVAEIFNLQAYWVYRNSKVKLPIRFGVKKKTSAVADVFNN